MYDVIGYQYRKYVNKQGRQVEGYNIYLTYTDKNTQGQGCLREWLTVQLFEESNIAIGDHVSFGYNKYGRVEAVHITD